MFPFRIKRHAKNVFLRDVEITAIFLCLSVNPLIALMHVSIIYSSNMNVGRVYYLTKIDLNVL